MIKKKENTCFKELLEIIEILRKLDNDEKEKMLNEWHKSVNQEQDKENITNN